MTRSWRVAAIALFAMVAAGVAGQLDGRLDLLQTMGIHAGNGAGSGRGGTNQAASSVPRMDDQAARVTAAQDLLSARAAAVKDRDKSAWMATVDPGDPPFKERQSVMFDNLINLPLGQFSYGPVQPAVGLRAARIRQSGSAPWAAAVTGTYSLAGFDRAPQTFEATYTLVHRQGRWRLSADTDGPTPLQVWDLPGLKVVRGRSSLVIGNASQARMREYATVADAAISRVSGLWGADWNSHVVLVTPATNDQFAALLLRSGDGGLDQVAAITQGVIESGHRAEGDRVVINPIAFTALQPVGRRVVITHELTHVAARSSTTGPVPIWLTEGMADYDGYSGLDISRQRVASELLALVRAGKGPTALPTQVDFDPARSKIAPSYSGAWLAVCRLVDLYGQARVVAFYRAVASARTVGGAAQPDPEVAAELQFPRSFGQTQAQFVAGWRVYLKTLAQA